MWLLRVQASNPGLARTSQIRSSDEELTQADHDNGFLHCRHAKRDISLP
jgi:hypothetical protein